MFSEADCPRLPMNAGLTVPLVATNRVISQLMLDIKMSHLASWTTSVFIYDDSIGKLSKCRSMIGQTHKSSVHGTSSKDTEVKF
jgi:hypothetical protein